jgi:DNA-binding SARP family transcriptional activator
MGADLTSERQTLPPGKPLALLAYLACAPGRAASREQLADLLWSDAEADAARHTLRQTLWYIKRKLGTDPFTTAGEVVRLAIPLPTDRDAFLAALDADDPARAVELYGGEFFPGFAAPGGAAFEQWADLERTRLRTLFIGAAARVVRDRLATGRAREALVVARRTQELAGRSQSSWRLVLECLLATGDLLGARVELGRLRQWLADEEDEPDPATTQLIRQVEAGRNTPLLASPTDESDPAPQGAGLTVELVGREAQFAQLLQAFEAARRGQAQHVHLSAPAGLGKTRLLDGLAGRLRAARARVVAVRAIPAERSLPYAFAGHLAGALVTLRGARSVSPESKRTLVALAPVASTYFDGVEPDRASDGDDALRRRSLALTELVAAVADDAPLALLVDDVHWMDAASRTVLAALAARAGNAQLLLVTAARSTDRFTDATPAARTLTLQPLSADDIGALVMSVAQLPGEPWAEELAGWLHASAGGSPLLVLEALQLAMERGRLLLADGRWQCPDPSALAAMLSAGRAMQQRIAALPPSAREALLRLAIAGAPVADADAARLLAADSREALSLLETRGLVVRDDDHWRPAHDEIAALAVELAADADRVRAHQAMAELLERTGESDLPKLLRAAWHRARAADVAALDRTFAAAVRRAQLSGEQAAITRLGREALGADVPADEVAQLVRRLPWRLRHRPRRWTGLAGLALGVAALAVAVLARPSAAGRDAALVLTLPLDGEARGQWVAVDLTEDAFRSVAPLESRRMRAPVADSVRALMPIGERRPGGDWIVSGMLPGRSTAYDLWRVTQGGSLAPLLALPDDQVAPRLSPDGRTVALATGHWHPEQRAELALLPVTGGDSLVRLTRSDAREIGHAWSPDGSRIAFVRSHVTDRPAELCWVSWDGATERCAVASDSMVTPSSIVGWRGDHALLVETTTGTTPGVSLALHDLRTGRTTVVDTGAVWYSAPPSGDVIACLCALPGVADRAVAVFSLSNPSAKRMVQDRGRPVVLERTGWERWDDRARTLARVRIAGPDTLWLGQPSRVRLRGFDGTGGIRPIGYARWMSLDTGILQVGAVRDDGASAELRPRREGVARLVAAAGPWVADTVTVTVGPARFRTELEERWTAPLERDWWVYGAPVPVVARTADGPALRPNGDAELTSGVASRRLLDVSGGAGLRVRIRAPIDRGQWQTLHVSLDHVAPDSALADWSERSRGLKPQDWQRYRGSQCGFSIPAAEGGEHLRRIAASAGAVRLPMRAMPDLRDGAWHEVEVQVLPDGRCGVATDGQLLALSDQPIDTRRPLRVLIEGQSAGTTIEVGAVEAWTGIRGDVAWRGENDDSAQRAPVGSTGSRGQSR